MRVHGSCPEHGEYVRLLISARSDACLVAVEGCDVKHVAVRANPDRLHLTISGQRSRMRGAARAEDLKREHKRDQLLHIWTNVGNLCGLVDQAREPSRSSCSGASCG